MDILVATSTFMTVTRKLDLKLITAAAPTRLQQTADLGKTTRRPQFVSAQIPRSQFPVKMALEIVDNYK